MQIPSQHAWKEGDAPSVRATESFLQWKGQGDMNTLAACATRRRQINLASFIPTSTNSHVKEGTLFGLTIGFLFYFGGLEELCPVRIRHQEHARLVELDVSYVQHLGHYTLLRQPECLQGFCYSVPVGIV